VAKHLFTVREWVNADWSFDKQRDEFSDNGAVVRLETCHAAGEDLRLT